MIEVVSFLVNGNSYGIKVNLAVLSCLAAIVLLALAVRFLAVILK